VLERRERSIQEEQRKIRRWSLVGKIRALLEEKQSVVLSTARSTLKRVVSKIYFIF
jgi:hypothetical protein